MTALNTPTQRPDDAPRLDETGQPPMPRPFVADDVSGSRCAYAHCLDLYDCQGEADPFEVQPPPAIWGWVIKGLKKAADWIGRGLAGEAATSDPVVDAACVAGWNSHAGMTFAGGMPISLGGMSGVTPISTCEEDEDDD